MRLVFLDLNCGGAGILQVIKFIWTLLDYVLVIIPIGLIVMVMMDFFKSAISGREDEMSKNAKVALKRVIFAMFIFLIPYIVKTSIHLLGGYGVDYAACLDIAKSESDLSKYTAWYEDGDFGNHNIVIPESLKKEKYKKKSASSISNNSSNSSSGGNGDSEKLYGEEIDWSSDAWSKNPYSCMGQCTWFAWGVFYQIYGYDPGFRGNGNQCASQLVAAHPDKFELSSTPKSGSVFSGDSAHNHVGIVLKVEGDTLYIRDGNYAGENGNILNCDSFSYAKTDWRDSKTTLSQFRNNYGDVRFAVPK